jgi:arsenate reductase-like glutaredoxin family protein
LRSELGADLEERDFARDPLSLAELKELFAGRDPRDFLNSKSPAFKARGLAGRQLSAAQALSLMAEEPNLIKRPLVIAGREIIAGFDRERLAKALKS